MRVRRNISMASIASWWGGARARWVIIAGVVAVTVIAGSATALASVPISAFSTVVLGDSYSAGEGVPNASGNFIPPTNTLLPLSKYDQCHRSYYAYSQDVAGTPGFPSASHIKFVACSFATISNFYHGNFLNHEPPQQSYLLYQGKPNTKIRLVMFTMGGNDIEFPAVMLWCVTHTNCQDYMAGPVEGLIDYTQPRLVRLYKQILIDAPNAKVFVLGYPSIVATHPSFACQLGGIQPGEAAWFAKVAVELDAAIGSAVRRVNSSRLHYVSALNAFAGGQACSRSGTTDGTYVNGEKIPPVYSFHPTRAGQEILASLIAHAVRKY
jgi:GDSL-like Lipase/Acylhydrolase family